jgi:Domain of unknown function (DUF4347)/Cadherin-like/Right handed beta helix region
VKARPTLLTKLASSLWGEPNGRTRNKYLIEELEERVLYSADDPLALASVGPQLGATTSAVIRTVPAVNSAAISVQRQTTELVVIDERVENIEVLKADFESQIQAGKPLQILFVTANENAIASITQRLDELSQFNTDVSALHLIGHGDSQGMQLGATGLNEHSVQQAQDQISVWANYLSKDADLLLYGCDFAQTVEGKLLGQKLAELTQADVAASTNITGSTELDGDWSLEFQTGAIEASLALSAAGQHSYTAILSLAAPSAEVRANIAVTAGTQSTTPSTNSVAIASNGSFVVVYTDPVNAKDIIFQRFNAAGVAQGAAITVNTTTSLAQQNPTLAMDQATGDFIVAWEGNGTGDGTGVFYRRFNAAGGAQDATEKRANALAGGTQTNPAIAMNSLNDFYIAWVDSALDGAGNGSGIYARRFNSTGAVGAGEIRVNLTLGDTQGSPSIATAPGRTVVIAWESNLQDLSSNGVYFRRFDAALNAISTETAISTVTAGSQSRPVVDMNASGNFVIAWQSPGLGTDLGQGIAAQRFDAGGNALGSNIAPVNNALPIDQDRPSVALADDGSFVVTWVSNTQDTSSTGVYGRAINANGTFDGAEFLINSTVSGAQQDPSVAYDGTKAIVLWNGEGTGDMAGVFFRQFNRVPDIYVNTVTNTTSELGTTATFSVVLTVAPTANVVINISSSDLSEGTLSASSLTFTATNWNTPQIVTITGVNDSFIDGSVAYSIVLAAASSTDVRYNNINANDVALINTDNDTVNTVTVTTISDLADGNVSSIAALFADMGTDNAISLREAIMAANNTVNGSGVADRIEFNIAGVGSHVLAPSSALPNITSSLVIDGFTQSGSAIGNLTTGTQHTLRLQLDGSGDLSAAEAGFNILASDVTIRGFNITGWVGNSNAAGIRIDAASNVLIEGNYIGTDITGASAAGNNYAAVAVINSTGTRIQNNLLSGNTQHGVAITGNLSVSNLITSNLIGTGANGNTNTGSGIGNGIAGIVISGDASSNTIGGTIPSTANTLAFNNTGVWVISGNQNAIIGNKITQNIGMGIDLGAAGLQTNDPADVDSGANDLQNYPVNTVAQLIGSNLAINAFINDAQPSKSFRVEFFVNPASAIEATGSGEGEIYLGAVNVSTDALGNATISTTFVGVGLNTPLGSKVSMTMTQDLGAGNYGSTSEFSLTSIVSSAPAITLPGASVVIAEAQLSPVSGISIADFETDLSTVSLSANNGQLRVTLSAGVVISAGLNGSGTLTLSGSQTLINTALATLTYQGIGSFNGSDVLNITATDALGLSTVRNLSITVTPVNTAPSISAPSGVQNINSNTATLFSLGNGKAIQISDVDSAGSPLEVTLSTDSFASFSLSTNSGLTFTLGDGANDSAMIFRGTASSINTALNGLSFTARSGTLIDPALSISVNDLGNTGAGTALIASTTINFKVFGIEFTDAGPRNTTEAGGSYTLGIRLRNQPTADVIIPATVLPPSGSTIAEASIAISSLTFTAANWNLAQSVVVTGLNDTLDDGDKAYSVQLGTMTSADPNYNLIAPVTVALTNIDNDSLNTIVVNTLGDVSDGDVSSLSALMSNKGLDGKISLREAILAANATVNGSGGADRIEFNTGVLANHDINLLSALPTLTEALVIDGTTEPDYITNGSKPVITLDGLNAGVSTNGLVIGASASNTTIQGLVIRRFGGDGISILAGANNTAISNNYIGRINSLSLDPGSGFENGGVGIRVAGASSLITGNIIRSNVGDGVRISGSFNQVTSNQIALNGASGISISSVLAQSNSLLSNILRNNAALAIDLGTTGSNVNDALDADLGANGLQNAPTLASATTTGGAIRITGTLGSAVNTNYRIQFFKAIDSDPSGYGEAGELLGSVDVTTDALGNASFNSLFSASVLNTDKITATATRISGIQTFETSEFALNINANTPGVTVTPISGVVTTEAGGTASFTIRLNAAPTSNVTINLSLSDTTEASLSQTAVVFTPLNWASAVTITATGLNDTFVDGNISYSILTSTALSTDLNYSGMAVADVALSNTDNDTVNLIYVDTLSDTVNGDTSSIETLVSNMGSDGRISLREAILASNATANGSGGADRILFNLTGSGNRVINITSALPTISDALAIDGQSLNGYVFGSAMVVLNGTGAGLSTNGLTLTSTGSQISGLHISGFTGAGIAIPSGVANHLRDNLLSSNGGLAIDLGTAGQNINDPLDSDTGANNLQNSPSIVAASTNGTTIELAGELRSQANSHYRIQIFASAVAHTSGTGQASILIGSLDVVTDTSGLVKFTSNFSALVPDGYVVSANATRSNATYSQFFDTSELSQAKQAVNAFVFYADANTAGYVENAVGAPLFTNGKLVTNGGLAISGIVVEITSGFEAGADEIAWTPTGGLTGFYDASTGIFQIFGNAPLADYLSALNSLKFSSSSNSPSTLTREVSVTVTSAGKSNATAFNLEVISINDLPTIVTNTGLSVAEGATQALTPTSLTATDLDSELNEDRNLAYRVTFGPVNGYLQRTTLIGTSISSFTQGEIDDGLIQYVHNGNNSPTDLFKFTLSDGVITTGDINFSITVDPVNDAPIATSSGLGVTYTENLAPVLPFLSVTLTDIDNADLAGAVITLTNPEVSDLLGFVSQNGITGIYDSGTKRLTLTGTASRANYEAAIRSITYENSSDKIALTLKTLTLTVSDGNLDSVQIHEDIRIVNINDTPKQTVNIRPDVNEGNSIAITNAFLNFTDDESGSSQVIFTVRTAPTNGSLELTTNPGNSISSFTQLEIENNRVVYVHFGEENTSDTFEFDVKDGVGATSARFTFNVRVRPIDDAATISLPTSAINYTEDSTGVAVASAAVISDPDNTNLTSVSISISSGYANPQDSLVARSALPPGIVAVWNAASGTLTLSGNAPRTAYQNALGLIDYRNNSQIPDTSTRTLSFTLNNINGIQGTATRQLNVASVNDAPSIAIPASTFNIVEDANLTLIGPTAIVISDVDAASTSLRVTLAVGALNQGASLSLSRSTGLTFQLGTSATGETIVFEGNLASINAALNGLVFNNGENQFGTNSISITVNDRGTTGSQSSQTITVNVSTVNDVPTISGTLTAGVEAATFLTLSPALLNATDVEASPILFTITTPPSHGVIERISALGVPVTTFTIADLQSGNLRYQHNSDPNVLDSFFFTASDGLTVTLPTKFEIVITRFNTAPQIIGSNPTVSYNEQGTAVLLIPDITIQDSDSASLIGATVTMSAGGQPGFDQLIFIDQNNIRGALDAQGNLTLSGLASVQDYQTALRSIRFENLSDTPSVAQRIITINVRDGSLVSNTSTVTLNIAEVNDAPLVSTAVGGRTLEDTNFIAGGEISVSDVDTASSGLLSITLSSSSGLISLMSVNGIIITAGTQNNSTEISFTGTQADITAALNSLTFSPSTNFTGTAEILVAVSDFGDSSSNNVETRTSILEIIVDPVNDAPTLGALPTSAIVYVEGSGAVPLIPGIRLSDIDSTQLTAASIAFSAATYSQGEDRLVITNTQGLTASWNVATGSLSISGVASLSVYESVLRSVTYENLSETPSAILRQFQLSVSDTSLITQSNLLDLQIALVNNASTVNIGTVGSYTENSTAVLIAPNLSISDTDSTELLGATMRIAGSYLAGADSLQFAGATGITASWQAGSGTLNLSGSASIAQYEDALRQVRFLTTTDNPTAPTRDFVIVLIDIDGSVSTANITGFVINAVNDAPVLSVAPSFTVTEDIAASIFSVSNNNLTISDIDANQQSLSLSVVATSGSLSLVNPNSSVSVQNASARELILSGTMLQITAAIAQISYISDANFSGSVQLQVTVQDINGARDVRTAQLQVIAVNDAPTISLASFDQVVTVAGAAANVLSGLTLSDVDSPLLDGAVVRISNNYATGDRISVNSIPKVQAVWDAATGSLTLSGTASAQEYQAILQTIQFNTTSTSLNARSVSLALKDTAGANNTAERIINLNSATSSNNDNNNVTVTSRPLPGPTTDLSNSQTGTVGATGSTVIGTSGASSTAQSSATSGQLGNGRNTGTNGAGIPGDGNTQNTSSTEEANASRDRRNRLNESSLKSNNQTGSGGDLNSQKTSAQTALLKESDSDVRLTLASSRANEGRADISNRLLLVANRESTLSANAVANALRLTLSGPEADSDVTIKVSKADQLAVDLLSLPVQSGGVVVSAAVLWWITRAGGLLTALLTSLPSWQHFDPLPILTSTDGREDDDWGDENEEDDKELDAVLSQ